MSAIPATPFAYRQLVFDRRGREGRYLGPSPNGAFHLVSPGYEAYDPDPEVGGYTDYQGLEEWPEIFARPPVEKLNAEVADLNQRIEIQCRVLDTIRKDQRAEEQHIAARKDRLKQHAQLAQLDDYLAGKITHFVVLEHNYDRNRLYGVRIDTFKDALTKDNRWSQGGMKLLVLFGDSKGDLTWHLNDYAYDRDSSKETVIPCTSLEQATAKVREIYAQKLAEWRADPKAKGVWSAAGLIKHAEKLGCEIPQDAVLEVERDRVQTAEHRAAMAKEAFAKAEAELQAALLGRPVESDEPFAPQPPTKRG